MFFHYFASEAATWPPNFTPDLTKAGLGGRLARCRRERGLQQKILAKRAGIAAVTLSRFENGASRPSLPALCRLAHALDVSVDYLVGRTDAQLAHRTFGIESAQQAGLTAKAALRNLLGEMTQVLTGADGLDWGSRRPEPSRDAS